MYAYVQRPQHLPSTPVVYHRGMLPVRSPPQRMDQESPENSVASSTTTNGTYDFSFNESRSSVSQVASSSSSHFGDDEDAEEIKKTKKKISRRNEMSKKAQNFCFTELNNAKFFLLWNHHCTKRKRMSYIQKFQSDAQEDMKKINQ